MEAEMEKRSPIQIADQIKARDVQTGTQHTATKLTTSQEHLLQTSWS